MDVSDGRALELEGLPPDSQVLPSGSDTLSDVLEAVKLTGAVFFLVDARTPWVAEAPASSDLAPVILPRAQHIVSYHVVSRGICWCESTGHATMRLETGDVLVVPQDTRINWRVPAGSEPAGRWMTPSVGFARWPEGTYRLS
jgi:hypothetical protein